MILEIKFSNLAFEQGYFFTRSFLTVLWGCVFKFFKATEKVKMLLPKQ